ncbi:MBL fold metallo-hydrolase [Streptomyces tricolor]|nr:MBL fold metallo-hydrolase [Streptomyces tricolor]
MTGKTEERLEELGDGVFAHVQLDGGWCLNNSGIIVGSDSTVVVDTAATMRRAALLRDTVARLSPRPVTTVVNTHHHGDHCFGNCVFGPETSIVAHDLARTELDAGGLALTKLWPDSTGATSASGCPTSPSRSRSPCTRAGTRSS